MSDTESIRHYLLGTASPEECLRLENEYLSDTDLLEEFIEAENDLIDSYVRGCLSPAEKQAFEKHYLGSPQNEARVHFAETLAEASRQARASQSAQTLSFWQQLVILFQIPARVQWGLAAAALIVIVLVVGWWRVNKNPGVGVSSGLPHEQTTSPKSPNPAIDQSPQAQSEPATSNGSINAFVVQLSAGVSRSAGSKTKTFSIPAKTSRVAFHLELENDDFPAYTAIVETAEGKEVSHVAGLKSQLLEGNRLVVLELAAPLIHAGDYVIRLRGAGKAGESEEDVETYLFRATQH